MDQLPDETIVKVAYELFGADSAIVKAAETTEEEAKREGESAEQEREEKEATADGESEEKEEKEEDEKEEEKTAADLQKADFYGRVMAHSFVQERNLIEKNAAGGKVGLLARLGKSAKGLAESAKSKGTEALASGKKFVKKHPGGVAGAAAGVGAAGGFMAGRASKGEKQASALDVLAEKRAMEILQANGISTDGQNEEVKLAEAVEQRAQKMLQEAGYVFE